MPGFGTTRHDRVGAMRHRVVLQSKGSGTVNDRGHYTDAWTNVATLPAAIVTLSGRDAEIARQISADATHRLRMRFDSRVNAKSRLKFGDRVFYVGHLENVDEVGRWMHLLVAEKR